MNNVFFQEQVSEPSVLVVCYVISMEDILPTIPPVHINALLHQVPIHPRGSGDLELTLILYNTIAHSGPVLVILKWLVGVVGWFGIGGW